MSDPLPSLDDFTEPSDLPSVDTYLKEEELPSVDEFVEEEEEKVIEEATQTLEDAEGNSFVEVKDIVPPWPELIRLVNDLRESIPEIPEIKSYDKELEELTIHIEEVQSNIPTIPEIKYYDEEVEAICEQIDNVKHHIANLPEVKYYDEQLSSLEEKLVVLKDSLPEVKYYDTDIKSLDEKIDEVRDSIPNFPKWVNEVNEVPDFSWIGKTFSVIDDDFVKVGDHIKDLKTKFDSDIDALSESLDTKDFESRVEIKELKENLKEAKEKIYHEIKESAIRIWDHHTQFKDDDRKLKKQVLSKLNETKGKLEKQILEFNNKNYETNKEITNYFKGLKEEVSSLPKVKYYDEDVLELKKDISQINKRFDDNTLNIAELYKLVEQIKGDQNELKEIYNDRPLTPDPDLKQGKDPLTPTGQEFATLKDLAANYRLFVNRVEQQLYTIGGGGAGFLKDLDDVNISGLADGDTILWNASTSKWDVGTVSSGSTTWVRNSTGIHTMSNVGIGTTNAATELYVKGDVTITGDLDVTGDIVYDEQTARNLNVTGIATINTLGVTGITTVGILTAYESVTIGSTNVLTALSGKTSIGLAIALG